jgi:hypothetical protein
METPEQEGRAMWCAEYFKDPSVEASAHWCVDDHVRVRSVLDKDSAWTMPPTNGYSLNVEMAGYAGQSDGDWMDDYSKATMDIAALCVAEWCVKFSIPIRHLTTDQIAAGVKGIAGHVDVNAVYHASNHYDPGPNFPWDYFLGRVRVHAGQQPPPPKRNVTELQKAVRTVADNDWGTETDKHCEALRQSTPYGGENFPYGVRFAQLVVGTTQDGTWGPVSKLALTHTVANFQRALNDMGFQTGTPDGDWGPHTNSAYVDAKRVCHD